MGAGVELLMLLATPLWPPSSELAGSVPSTAAGVVVLWGAMFADRGGAELLRPGGLVSLRSWAACRAVPVGGAE
eukprot:10321389-Heterocapsa_arctica.AAC.1